MDFAQKTVVVFGASRGNGLATATHFAKAGANVVMLASNLRALEQAAEEIGPMSGSILIRVCDVADYKQVENMINFTFSSYERLDVVVNNAGVIEPLSVLHESDPEVWSRAVDINFKGVYYSMRAALPIMRSQQFGTIINMSSGAANSALNGWSHYCSTKSAAKKLTEVAHVECQNDGINIIGLSPGTVATDMMRKIKDANINVVSKLEWSKHIPEEWVAKAVAYLCGPEGAQYRGTDFSLKTNEGRRAVGLPLIE